MAPPNFSIMGSEILRSLKHHYRLSRFPRRLHFSSVHLPRLGGLADDDVLSKRGDERADLVNENAIPPLSGPAGRTGRRTLHS